ncbi:hypothetical protein K3495_g1050 [Podosphaera aphanis]|nr:hypothetical protein K3495_g1050 [Podosphaera aphanis]
MSDPTNEAEKTATGSAAAKAMNVLIGSKIAEYNKYKFKDDNHWEAFKDDFCECTAEDFKHARLPLQRVLRSHLRTFGVWVKWDRKTTIAKSPYNVVKEEIPTEWTLEEISSSNETFSSNKIATIMNRKIKFEHPETKSDENYDNSFAKSLTDKYISEQDLRQDLCSAKDDNPSQKSRLR